MRIEDCAFFVTGGASGLGLACCEKLVSLGARVGIADINAQAADEVAQRLGANALAVATDVTSESSVAAAMESVSGLGPIYGVINCAGIEHAARVVSRSGPHPLDAFSRVINVNLIGTFNVIRLLAAAMVKNEPKPTGERGVIINTASIAAFEGQIGQAAYSASKGGVVAMTLPIARELAPSGIRVMTIAPGIFGTPLFERLSPAVKASLEQLVPFPPRVGKPEEFASLVQHIFENPMLNGEVVRLDGALRLGPK